MAHPHDVAIPVPYVSKLGSTLEPGQTLIIHGVVNSDAENFEVNLLNGSPEIETSLATVLHVKAQFNDGKLLFNTYEHGKWGKVEHVSNPFKRGEEFDLRVRIHDDKFEIFANHKEVHEYKTRVNIASVQYIAIRGSVHLRGVHWGGRYYTLPFDAQFPHGHLKSGERVFVYGLPKGDRFEVDFLGSDGDVLFHFNPRMKEKKVVRNAEIGKVWGQEEREGEFPFKKEIGADLAFYNEPYSIQVFVNGERFCAFAHRTADPGHDYKGLRVAGDFELTGLEFSN